MTPRSWHYHADEAIARERRGRPIAKAIPSDPPAGGPAAETSGRVVFLTPAAIYEDALIGTARMPDGTRRAVYDGNLASFLRSESLSRMCSQHDTCWPEDHREESDDWLATVEGVLILDDVVQLAW